MRKPLRLSSVVLLASCAAASCPALTLSEWQHRQALGVAAPGLVRVELGAATFDAAGLQQEDLRVVDPAGNEVAILMDRPPAPSARVSRPSSFEVRVAPGSTEILVATGTKEKLSSLSLETPSPFFLRPAKVEISEDDTNWVTSR